MNTRQLCGFTPLIGVLIIIPAVCFAADNSCAGYAPTFPSNYSEEASGLLQNVQTNAQQVADRISELNELAADPNVSWGIHAEQLARIQTEIGDMERSVCRLDVIQPVVPGWEGRSIPPLREQVETMANAARQAYDYVTHPKGELWSQPYTTYTQTLYKEASDIAERINRGEQLSALRTLDSEITMEPGLAGK